MTSFPFEGFVANQWWLNAQILAQNLVFWTACLLQCPTWTPKRLRALLFSTAAMLVKNSRYLVLRYDKSRAYTNRIIEVFSKLQKLITNQKRQKRRRKHTVGNR